MPKKSEEREKAERLTTESQEQAMRVAKEKLEKRLSELSALGDVIESLCLEGSAALGYTRLAATEQYTEYSAERTKRNTAKHSLHKYLKVVRKGTKDAVLEKENVFRANARLFEEIEGNLPVKAPSKTAVILFRLTGVLYAFAVLFLLFVLPACFDNAINLSHAGDPDFFLSNAIFTLDLFLFTCIPNYFTLFPYWVMIIPACIAILLFVAIKILSVRLNRCAKDEISNMIPIIILAAAALVFALTPAPEIIVLNAVKLPLYVLTIVYLVLQVKDLITNKTYKSFQAKAEARAKFVQDGTYAEMKTLQTELLS